MACSWHWTRRYVFGIFLVSALHEIVSTILDYQMQQTAWAEAQASGRDARNELAAFNGFFGQARDRPSPRPRPLPQSSPSP